MLAVRLNCDDKMMDYLLSRNISPAERDSNRGFVHQTFSSGFLC